MKWEGKTSKFFEVFMNIILICMLICITIFVYISVCSAEPMAGCQGSARTVPEPQNGVYLIRDAERGVSWTEVYRDGLEVIVPCIASQGQIEASMSNNRAMDALFEIVGDIIS